MYLLYQRFRRSIAWNAVESIIYHTILLSHQIALLKIISFKAYGLIGALFALIYLTVMIIDLGLDVSLSSFFFSYAHSKSSIRRFIIIHILPNYLLYAMITLGICVAKYFFVEKTTLLSQIDPLLLGIILFVIAIESIKKTLKVWLQLIFKFNVTVSGEIGSIAAFVTFVWSGFAFGYTLDSFLIFTAMLGVAILETLWFVLHIYRWYQALPETNNTQIAVETGIVKTRLFVYLNQLSKLIVSGNFLVPLFAYTFGLEYAGILKLATNITHSITVVLEKTFGTASSVILAHAKKLHKSAKCQLFLFITNQTNQILLSCFLFFFINYAIFLGSPTLPLNQWALIYLYFSIHFCESFFIPYERFFITEGHAGYLAAINTTSILPLLLLRYYSFSPSCTLGLILCVRLFSFALLYKILHLSWPLRSKLYVNTRYITLSLIFSLIFFVIMHYS